MVLHADSGAYALQKRDFSPGIYFRGYWCLFGGLVEEDESPQEAAAREVLEELDLRIEAPVQLMDLHWGPTPMPDGRPRRRHYFRFETSEKTLRGLKTNEGLGLKVFEPGTTPDLSSVVPWDAAALGVFLAERNPADLVYPRSYAANP